MHPKQSLDQYGLPECGWKRPLRASRIEQQGSIVEPTRWDLVCIGSPRVFNLEAEQVDGFDPSAGEAADLMSRIWRVIIDKCSNLKR